MSITSGSGRIIVDFHIQGVSGAPAVGAYLLRFSVGYAIPGSDDKNLLFRNVSAKVFIGTQSKFLGIANPEVPRTFQPHKYNQNAALLFELLLTSEVIEAIEKYRLGGDIEFTLEIVGEYCDQHNQLNTSDRITYKANQKSWVEILKQMQYSGILVFELPMDIEPDSSIKTALVAIEKAKEYLYYGNYDDVIAKCRFALEGIIPPNRELNQMRNEVKTDKKGMSKQQRFFHILDSLMHFTNLAHHPAKDGSYTSFSRSEAIFVLGSTISAISSKCEQKI